MPQHAQFDPNGVLFGPEVIHGWKIWRCAAWCSMYFVAGELCVNVVRYFMGEDNQNDRSK
tara:strand:- start:458 stop:637 length:180 start_codon:yes stop_codon:yes gene_type:complete